MSPQAAASADMAVTETGPAFIGIRVPTTYTITLTNKGPDASSGVVLTNTISGITPAQFTDSYTPAATNPDTFTFSTTNGGSTAVETANGPIAAGNVDVFFHVLTVTGAKNNMVITNTANVTATTPDPNPSNNTSVVNSTLVEKTDLSVTKTGPANATAGTQATYTIMVTNKGPLDAVNVLLTDALPAGETLVSAKQTGGPDTFSNTSSGNTASFTATKMALGNTDSFQVVAQIASGQPNGSSLKDTATVSATNPDPNPSNNSSSVTTTVSTAADLAVIKSGPANIVAGTQATYTITLTDKGPSDAQSVSLSDALPSGLTRVSEKQLSGPDVFTDTSTGNTASFSATSVVAGNTDTFQVVALAASNLANGSTLTDTASVTSPTFDPNTTNNSSSVTSTVVAAANSADLAVTKSGPAVVTAGTPVTYTLKLTNNGPAAAQTVILSDLLPNDLLLLSEKQLGGPDAFTNTSTGNTPRFSATTMGNGNTDTFQVVAFAPSSLASGTPLSDTASVAASTPDPNLANNSFALGETVATSADLSLTKTGPAFITAGSSATYTITLTNLGPSDAASVALTDALPAGLTLVSEMQTGGPDAFVNTSSGNTAKFTATSMSAGGTDTFVVVVNAASGLAKGSSVTETASVTSSTPDPNSGNNSSSVTTTVATAADLAVTKSGPATIAAGAQVTYTLTLTDLGPSDARSVSLSDALPSGLTRVSETQLSGPDVFTDSSTGNTPSFSATTVVAGHTDTFQVVALAASTLANGSSVTDTASVTSSTFDPNLANNSSSVTSTVATSADLAVTKSGPATVTAGTTATYMLTVTNKGPSNAQTVSLSDALPSGLLLQSEQQLSGPDAFTDTSTGNTPRFNAATMGSGNIDTFQVVAFAPSSLASGTPLSDTASVASSTFDSNLTNNTFILGETVATSADLSLTKTGPAFITAGSSATYTITLTNLGPSDAASVALTDAMPAGLTLVSEMQTSGPDAFVNASSGNTAKFTATAMSAGGTDTFVVVVNAASGLAKGSSVTETASVTSSTTDPNSGNNSSSVTTTVATAADLAVTKTGPATVAPGTVVTYTITLTDNGPSDAQSVSLSDALPTGLTRVSEKEISGPDVFTDTSTGNSDSFSAVSVVAGNTDAFQVVALVASNLANGSTLTDTASDSSPTFDPNLANNSSSVTSTVATSADLSVTKSGPATVTAGTSVTYTITLTNNGPADAQTVILSDALPDQMTLISETQLGGPDVFTDTSTGNTPRFSAATVGNGNIDTFQVVAFAPSSLASGTPLSDTASVVAATFDSNLTNNSFTLGETVATSADVSVTKTGPAVITAGASATYTITLTNLGPSDAASVALTDALPGGLTLVSEMQTGGPDAFVNTSAGNTASFTAVTMVSGGSDTFVVVASAPSGLANGTSLTDTASVSSTTFDPDLSNNSSSVTSTVATSADLSVTKTGPSTITAGTTITYTITLNNLGPSDSQTVALSDTLPTGLTLVSEQQLSGPDVFADTSAGNTASFSATTVGASNTDTFQVVALAANTLANGSSVTDTASVTSSTTDPNSGNNSSSFTSTVATSADLAVTKTGPATIVPGTLVTYTITLTDSGPSDAQTVALTDALPAGLTLVSETQTGGPDAFVDTSAGNTASFSAATMGAGNTDTFQVEAMVASNLANGSTLTDTASVTSTTFDPNLANNSSSFTSTVANSADLAVTKSGPAVVTAGTSVTYTLTLTNNGPADAQTVSLSDALPDEMTLISETQLGGPDTFTNTSTGNTPRFSAATMGNGNTDTFQVVAFAPSRLASGTPLSDTASVAASTPDPNLVNNTFTLGETVATSADVSVTKSGPAVITAGSSATYTITLTNLGPSDAASVALTDTLPTGLTLVSEMQTGGPDTFVNASSGNTAKLTATSMSAGGIDTFVVVASAASGLVNGSTVTDTASATSSTFDPDTTNNSSSVSSTVATSADLAVTKTGPGTITAGTTVTYTITLNNLGPSDAQTVALTDALPAGETLVSETQTGGPDAFTNTSTGNTASFNAATMGSGNTDTFEVVAAAASSLGNGTTLTDTASVSSATFDPNLANNTSSFTSNVVTSADLAVTKTGPATASEGDVLTYTISVTNNGPADAQAVMLTDSLPANETLISANVGGVTGTLSGSTITFSLGTVAAGATRTGTVVVQATEDGSTTDTASVTSPTPDSNLSNNTVSATTVVAEPGITLHDFNVVATEFVPITGTVAAFTHDSDVEPAGAFSATINWGDGTTSAGIISKSATDYQVVGTHTYTTQSNSAVTVTVSEDNVSVQGSAPATVSEFSTSGVSGKLEQFICDTLEDDFNQPPTALQCQSIKNALQVLEISGAETLIKTKHVNPIESLLFAAALGKQEFTLIAGITSANGTSLESAVSDIVNAFLLQSLTETLGPGVAGE
jgi:uncharacterized repeat protein (TIGR01451 family)